MKRLFNQYIASFSGLPKKIWTLSLVILINRSGTMIIFFLSLYLTRELGYSIATAGKVIGVYGLGALLGCYAGGQFVDRYGAHRIQFFSLLLSGLFLILCGYLRNLEWLTICLFVQSAISDAFRPANLSSITEACPSEVRARGFALNRLAINLGLAIGPAIGGLLATKKYLYLFWADGLTCIIAALVFLILTRNWEHPVRREHTSTLSQTGPFQNRFFMALMGFVFLLGVVFNQIFTTWPLYMRNQCGFPEDIIGLFIMMNAVLIVFFEMPLVRKVEKKPPFNIMIWGGLLLFTGISALPISHHLSYVLFTVILWTFGEMMIFPLLSMIVSELASESNRGKYMGFFTLTFSACFVVSPALGGWLYESYGPTVLWSVMGFIGCFVLIGFYFLKRAYPLHQKKTQLIIPPVPFSVENSG